MYARQPEFHLEKATVDWAQVPEFSAVYNGASLVIPVVEHYLNQVMKDVKARCGNANPELAEEIDIFTLQETIHATLHKKFNQCLFDAGIDELKPLMKEVAAELRQLRETRSLAFNIAFCAGFETIATFGSKYLYEQCDQYFEGADPYMPNLILWHVAEEFEHRATCHRAFNAVSGNYFMRLYAMAYAFRVIGGYFRRAEAIVLAHYRRDLPSEARSKSERRSIEIFRRQMRYLIPRMVRIGLPGYDPAHLPMSPRIAKALDYFKRTEPITQRYDPAIGDVVPAVHT